MNNEKLKELTRNNYEVIMIEYLKGRKFSRNKFSWNKFSRIKGRKTANFAEEIFANAMHNEIFKKSINLF